MTLGGCLIKLGYVRLGYTSFDKDPRTMVIRFTLWSYLWSQDLIYVVTRFKSRSTRAQTNLSLPPEPPLGLYNVLDYHMRVKCV